VCEPWCASPGRRAPPRRPVGPSPDHRASAPYRAPGIAGHRGAQALGVVGLLRLRGPKVSDDSQAVGLTSDELRRLLAAAAAHSPRSAALVTLLTFCGLRISEALGADVRHYGHDQGHRVLKVTRNGKPARVPLAPPVVRALDDYIGDRTSGPIFISGTDAHRYGYQLAYEQLGRRHAPQPAPLVCDRVAAPRRGAAGRSGRARARRSAYDAALRPQPAQPRPLPQLPSGHSLDFEGRRVSAAPTRSVQDDTLAGLTERCVRSALPATALTLDRPLRRSSSGRVRSFSRPCPSWEAFEAAGEATADLAARYSHRDQSQGRQATSIQKHLDTPSWGVNLNRMCDWVSAWLASPAAVAPARAIATRSSPGLPAPSGTLYAPGPTRLA
jgi:hypothetical protein